MQVQFDCRGTASGKMRNDLAVSMTQIRAFSKRLGVTLNDLKVDVRVIWNWEKTGKTYVTEPESFEIDIDIDSPDDETAILELIDAAKKGCFIEQTLKQPNTVRHRYKTPAGWCDA